MPILSTLKKLKKSFDPYQPLIEVQISRQALLHNLKTYQSAFPSLKFAPVLKSNAYGHGLIEVASVLDGENLPFFMVDSLFEARALRRAGIKTPLLILGYTTADNITSVKLKDAAFGITSLEQLRAIGAALKRPTNFHLKIDTGMHRQGLSANELPGAIDIIKNNHYIKIEGLCSHLADADGETGDFNLAQINLWNELAAKAEQNLGNIKYKHLTNSAGSDLAEKINANVGRLGIGLYGFNMSPRRRLELKPALSMRSVISSVRSLKPGDNVGYNSTFTAPKEMKVATVPVGYAEGLDRRLSNCGAMMVGETVCPIVGRVSMNMTSVDVSGADGAHLNQKVIIFSDNPKQPNSVENLAKLCNTVPYEILVRIPGYLRRTII